ncbi:hypothetical protein Droror1_Dr00007725 [Drosera rotundifolia]
MWFVEQRVAVVVYIVVGRVLDEQVMDYLSSSGVIDVGILRSGHSPSPVNQAATNSHQSATIRALSSHPLPPSVHRHRHHTKPIIRHSSIRKPNTIRRHYSSPNSLPTEEFDVAGEDVRRGWESKARKELVRREGNWEEDAKRVEGNREEGERGDQRGRSRRAVKRLGIRGIQGN